MEPRIEGPPPPKDNPYVPIDIKFINEPGSSPAQGAFDIPANKNCEAKAREYFKVAAHGTPGIDAGGFAESCPDYDVEAHMKSLQGA